MCRISIWNSKPMLRKLQKILGATFLSHPVYFPSSPLIVLCVILLTARLHGYDSKTATGSLRYKSNSNVHKRHWGRWNQHHSLCPDRYVNIRLDVSVRADNGIFVYVSKDRAQSTTVVSFSVRIICPVTIVTELWWEVGQWEDNRLH